MLERMPRHVHSRSSPWFGYLAAVYDGGHDVPIPFDLSSLRFAYHATAAWLRRHPTTDWPMASCVHAKHGERLCSSHSSNGCELMDVRHATPSRPMCPRAACTRWERRAGEESAAAALALAPALALNGNGTAEVSSAITPGSSPPGAPRKMHVELFVEDDSHRSTRAARWHLLDADGTNVDELAPNRTWVEACRAARL